jgi:hypothetical protein
VPFRTVLYSDGIETGRQPHSAYRTPAKKGLDVHAQITRDENYYDDDADDVEDHCFYSGYARVGDSLPRSIRRSFERPRSAPMPAILVIPTASVVRATAIMVIPMVTIAFPARSGR